MHIIELIKPYWAFFILATSVTFISGCQPSEPARAQLATQVIRLHGSNTIGEDFAPRLINAFLRQQQAQNIIEQPVKSAVERRFIATIPATSPLAQITAGRQAFRLVFDLQAHGSTTGYRDLMSNSTDIWMASRPAKKSERARLLPRFGDITRADAQHSIALDALAIVVNPDNPLRSITIKQLAAIFSGQVQNWRAIGGADLPVRIFARDHNSGTWDTFRHLVLKPNGARLDANAARFESSHALVEAVRAAPGGIGFIGISYASRARTLAVAADATQTPRQATRYSVGTSAYPLSRKLFLYVPPSLQSPLVKAFIQFVESNIGQRIAPEAGLVAYYPFVANPNNDAHLPARYQSLLMTANRLSLTFNGSNKSLGVATEQRDLQRLKNYLRQNPRSRLILAGRNPLGLQQLTAKLKAFHIMVYDRVTALPKSRAGTIEIWSL